MLSNVLFILLGAGLVSVGFLTAAFAAHLRSSHVPREAAPHGRPRPAPRTTPIPVDAIAELLRTTVVARPPRAPRPEPRSTPRAIPNEGSDVITALVEAGYKGSTAATATWACSLAERTTIESWTAAALRRCARAGVVS